MTSIVSRHKWKFLGIGMVFFPLIVAPITVKNPLPWVVFSGGLIILGAYVVRGFYNWTNRFFK